MSTINQFRQQLENGGHRQNRFKVTVNFPTRTLSNAPKAQTSFEFLAFATAMPVQNLGEIPLKYRGRTVYFAGDPAEPEIFTCSVYNSLSFDIRNACIDWRNNYINPDSVVGEDLIDTAEVQLDMLDKADNIIQTGILYNAWPRDIGQVAVSWQNENALSTFDLGIRFDWVDERPINSSSNTITTI